MRRTLWQKYVCPLCIIGQLIVNTTLDKTQVFGKIPTQNVTTVNMKGEVKCVWYSLNLVPHSDCQIADIFTRKNCSKPLYLHQMKFFCLTDFWQLWERGEIWNCECGVMKSVVTLLIKVVHISTNSSQSPPIWEEIMTWLTQSRPWSQYNIRSAPESL